MFLGESLNRAYTTSLKRESPNWGLEAGKIARNLKEKIESFI